MHRSGDSIPPGAWDSAAHVALPTKTPSLSLGRGIPPRNRRQALLPGGGHLLSSSASIGVFLAKAPSLRLKPKGGSAGGVLVQERGFLVLTDIPIPVLGESCTTSIKDFAFFPPHQKKKKTIDHIQKCFQSRKV